MNSHNKNGVRWNFSKKRTGRRRGPASKFLLTPFLVAALLAAWLFFRPASTPAASPQAAPTETRSTNTNTNANTQGLPPEAIETLRKIRNGEQLPYRRDGVVFENRERLLPPKPRGYYHEYTVPTPGASTRGARRIVTGGDPPEVWYYSADHYRSFRQITL